VKQGKKWANFGSKVAAILAINGLLIFQLKVAAHCRSNKNNLAKFYINFHAIMHIALKFFELKNSRQRNFAQAWIGNFSTCKKSQWN